MNSDKKELEILKNNMVKVFAKYVIAALVSMVACSVLNIIDGIFIARRVGDIGVAAINVAWPYCGLMIALGGGIATGAAILISNKRGEGKWDEVKRYKGSVISLLQLLAFLITPVMYLFRNYIVTMLGGYEEIFPVALDYLTIMIYGTVFLIIGEGMAPLLNNSFKVKEATIIFSLGCVLNIIGDYLLIIHYNYGIKGAAYATLISEVFMALFGLIFLLGDSREKLTINDFKINFKMVIQIIKQSIPTFGILLSDSIIIIFYIRSSHRYGGIAAQSTISAILYMNAVFALLIDGISNGVIPLISMANGMNDKKLISDIMKLSCRTILLFSFVLVPSMIWIKKYVPIIYSLSDKASSYVFIAIFFRAISLPIAGLKKLFIAYYNSTCKVKIANVLVYIDSLVLTPVCCFLLPLFLGLNGVWATFFVVQILVCGLAIVIKSFESKESV